jgi:Metalloenzyme superfamily
MLVRICSLAAIAACFLAAENRTENVILVTADGLRWQELFNGIDPVLIEKHKALRDALGKETPEERRMALMPFFWGTLAKQGIVLGNVNKNSSVRVTNGFRVSYPGYSEILTGRAQDDQVRGNDRIQNPTPTILEFLRGKLNLRPSQVALFASWDVFKYIGESRPGSIFINAGYKSADGSAVMRELSALQNEALTPWDTVRHDYVTLNMALDYMKREKPRVTYIALGETDDWAHDRRYDRVVAAIQYFDLALRRINEFVESTPEYRQKTSIVITSDHGRGSSQEDWHGHGAKVPGAEQIWLAIAGPDTPALGEVSDSPAAFQRDVAPTILNLLGIGYKEYSGVEGKPVP